jgi:hypothetical protein
MSYVEPYKGGGQLYKNLPFFYSQTITSDQNGAPPLYLSQGIPAPVAPALNNIAALSSGNPTAWDFGMVPTRTLQWSLGIERQLLSNLMLDVTYVGTRSLDVTSAYDYNQPAPGPGAQNPRRPLYGLNPLVGDITYNSGWGSARYHGLQLKVENAIPRV